MSKKETAPFTVLWLASPRDSAWSRRNFDALEPAFAFHQNLRQSLGRGCRSCVRQTKPRRARPPPAMQLSLTDGWPLQTKPTERV
jgi:hypothetical protein